MLTLPATKHQPQKSRIETNAPEPWLAELEDNEWFVILHTLEWEAYREIAAGYYDALYAFNLSDGGASDPLAVAANDETQAQARQRLLWERATMASVSGEAPPILYPLDVVERATAHTDPLSLAPGVVPARLAGRQPKCFFSLLKSFIGAPLMGFGAEPESVYLLLKSNPSFARVCGFVPKAKEAAYDQRHVPSLRKLEQFDQVMRQAGLWDRIKRLEVSTNLASGVIKPEKELVGDTTHYHAYSSFETVKYHDDKDHVQKKSQSKVTKACRCADRDTCAHAWELADEGAGTIVKSKTKIVWGHKASIIGLPQQGAIIDVQAVSDAPTHDGQTFFPHVQQVFDHYPSLAACVTRVLYDSACDDRQLKIRFQTELGVELRASFNPRAAKPITTGLPRGITTLTPYGEPICLAGQVMDYRGIRYQNETFIYQAPHNEQGLSVCLDCPQRRACCQPTNTAGRTITVAFDTLAHIDAQDPPMAKRFKAIMARRPSVERMIKRLKCDLGNDRLSKRGNGAFQAFLDKTLIGYQLLLRHLH